MKDNLFLKILASIPVILVMLYFIPFLGICLLLFRYFTYSSKSKNITPIVLVVVGLLILLPNGLYKILDIIKFDIKSIPYFSDIINSKLYSVNFIKYGRLLIIIGVIFSILYFSIKKASDKLGTYFGTGLKKYIEESEKRDREIAEKNDLIMRERQLKAKNTHFVVCPNCGADNVITESIGTCKYCRKKLVYTEK